jgi:hypothetical protein
MTRTTTIRKLTRLQTLFTGGAFVIAGLLGGTTPALAADTTPTTSDQAAAVVEQITQNTQATAPSAEELHPLPITAEQKTFTPTKEQLANAKAIVDTAKDMGLPPRAWTIAVATSLQETNLRNLGHLGDRNDHDSQGLFQQRPSSGWGTVDQITDPHYATRAFFEGTTNNRGLLDINGWDTMPPDPGRPKGPGLRLPQPLRQARKAGRRHHQRPPRHRPPRRPRHRPALLTNPRTTPEARSQWLRAFAIPAGLGAWRRHHAPGPRPESRPGPT